MYELAQITKQPFEWFEKSQIKANLSKYHLLLRKSEERNVKIKKNIEKTTTEKDVNFDNKLKINHD